MGRIFNYDNLSIRFLQFIKRKNCLFCILHFGTTALCEGWSIKKHVLAVFCNVVIVDYLIFEFIYN